MKINVKKRERRLTGRGSIITLYVIKICIFGDYIAEFVAAKALPLSIVLVAISILFFSIGYENRA